MKRAATACLILVAFLLLVAMAFTASAQVVNLKIDAIWPTKFGTGAQKPATGTNPVSTGLSVVPVAMRAYFVADTTGSGSTIVSSFSWSVTARPVGSTANFAQSGTISDTLIPDVEGVYTIQLVAGGKMMTQNITASNFRGSTTDQGLRALPRRHPQSAGSIQSVEDERSRNDVHPRHLRHARSGTQSHAR